MFSTTVAQANSVLMLSASAPLAIAEIRRLAGISTYTATKSALDTLAGHDLVKTSDRAGTTVFAPNKESRYYSQAYQVALIDLPWIKLLEDAKIRRFEILGIFVHGSMARGTAGPKSDLDVLFVGGVEPFRIIEAMHPIEDMLGRTIDPAVFKAETIYQKIESSDRAIAAIIRDGVRVWGEFSE